MNTASAENIAETLLESGAITISLDKPYRFASGILSPIYTDNRIVLSIPTARDRILEALQRRMAADKNFDCIAGVATAGIPWAAMLSDRLRKPMIYVRSAPKDHGKENLIEGKFRIGDRIAVVEDLVSTGNSSLSAVNAIRLQKGKVISMYCIFTYGLESSIESFKANKVELKPLTNLVALVKVAKRLGLITDTELVLSWADDPKGWEEKWKAMQKE